MKVSIRFSLVSAKTDDKPIRMRISYDGLRLDMRTGFVCPPEKWDTDTMRMKAGTSNRYHESAATINREISKQESLAIELLTRYELDGKTPSPEELKDAFNRKTGRTKSDRSGEVSLLSLFDMYLTDPANVLESATVNSYITASKRAAELGFSEQPVDDITSDDLSEFITELWADGLENQSVDNYLSRIRTIMRYAHTKGLYHGSLHETFKPKLKGLGKKDVHYLEWDEFKKMLYVPLYKPLQIATRDAFCFCCATGLRVSDVSKLRWSDVHLDCETPHISIVAKKTSKPSIIELNQFSRAIIDRQLSPDMDFRGLVFPPVKTRTRNDELHSIAKAAGITGMVRELSFNGNKVITKMVEKADAISTHWGRHTFIVHALSLGISPTVVMQWTGHASYESMKPYIAIADSARKDNMDLFNN